MKRKRIALFIIISLFLQLVIFTLLDLKTEELLNPSYRFDEAALLHPELENAHSFSLSYNNRYLAYLKEDTLQVLDLINNELIIDGKKHLEGKTISAFKWLPDRNSLVYFAEEAARSGKSIDLFSLDFDAVLNTSNEPIPEPRLDRSIELAFHEIINIEMSTYTNNLYILYEDMEQHLRLITIDIMKNTNRLDNPEETIHTMAVSNKFGTIYLDSEREGKKTIWSMTGRDRQIISDNPHEILLGCTNEVLLTGIFKGDELQEIISYSSDSTSGRIKKSLWQGNITYQSPKFYISSNYKVFFIHNNGLDVLYPDGKLISKSFPPGHIIVLSPTGMMYLELSPQTNRFYWRSV